MSDSAAAIAEMKVTVTKIDGKLIELHAGVNRGIALLPPFVQDWVVSKWNEFAKLMGDVWNYYANIVQNLGEPDTLRNTATAWSTRVSNVISEKQLVAEAGELDVDDNWDGTAAVKYRQGLLAQRTALEKLRTSLSEPVVSKLNELAGKITDFIWILVGAVAALLAAIVIAVLTVATVVGAIVAGIGGALAFCSAVIGGMLKMESDANSIKAELQKAIDDKSGTVNGHWPVLVDTTGRAMQPGG